MARKKIKYYSVVRDRNSRGKRIYRICWPDPTKAKKKAFHTLEAKNIVDAGIEAEQYYKTQLGIQYTGKESSSTVPISNAAPKTMAELIDIYTSRRAAGHALTDQSHTIREVTNRLNKYVKPFLGHLAPCDVTPEHIIALRDHVREMPGRKNAPLSPKMVTYIMTETKTMLKYAVEKLWIPCNPYDSTLKLTSTKKKIVARVESLETYRMLIARPWKYPISHRASLLSMITGTREGEIRALREKDVVKKDGYAIIHIKHNIMEDGTLKPPKNGDERWTVIPIWVYEIIAELFIGEPDSFIFRNPGNKLPVTAPTILRGFRIELANLLGVTEEELKAQGTKFHSLRLVYNSAASNYFGGADSNILSFIMGHRSNSMQMRYFKLLDEHIPKILEASKEIFPDSLIPDIQEAFKNESLVEPLKPQRM